MQSAPHQYVAEIRQNVEKTCILSMMRKGSIGTNITTQNLAE